MLKRFSTEKLRKKNQQNGGQTIKKKNYVHELNNLPPTPEVIQRNICLLSVTYAKWMKLKRELEFTRLEDKTHLQLQCAVIVSQIILSLETN